MVVGGPGSEGLAGARRAGSDARAEGIGWLLAHAGDARIVFEATSAAAHRAHAPALAEAGLVCVDLTPAKLGPAVVPAVNMDAHLAAPDVNLITCGGPATLPAPAPLRPPPPRAP